MREIFKSTKGIDESVFCTFNTRDRGYTQAWNIITEMRGWDETQPLVRYSLCPDEIEMKRHFYREAVRIGMPKDGEALLKVFERKLSICKRTNYAGD